MIHRHFTHQFLICGQSRKEKALDFIHRAQGKGRNGELFLGTFVSLKAFLFPSFLFFLDPNQDLGVAKPSVAFLIQHRCFSFPPSLAANTEKDAHNLELC